MNHFPTASVSPVLSVETSSPALDWSGLFGPDSSDSFETPESPTTPLNTGNPSPLCFPRRPLPEALIGLSPFQFACGCVSSRSEGECTLKVCMLFDHHKRRAAQLENPEGQVVRCSRLGCRFVHPCLTHFDHTVEGQRRSRPSNRARKLAYFVLIRRLVLARTLLVPPPMPPCRGGGFS